MDTSDLLKGFLLGAQKTEKPSKKNTEEFRDLFKEIATVKIASIKEINKDIEFLIKNRTTLQHELFQDVEQTKIEINSVLTKFPIDPTSNPAVTTEHLRLRQKLIDLDEIKMKEKVDAWRDIAELKEELRKNQREIQEKQENLDIIKNLLQ